MSRLAEFRAAEKALQEQLAYLESMKNDAGLKREIKFEEDLKKLMQEYGKSLRDVVAILDPESHRAAGKSSVRGQLHNAKPVLSRSTRTRTPTRWLRPRAATTRC